MPVSSNGAFPRQSRPATRSVQLTKSRVLGLVLLLLGLVLTALLLVSVALR